MPEFHHSFLHCCYCSVTKWYLTLWDPMDCSMPGFLVMPSNHVILCCPLLLLPSIFPSITVFSNKSVLHIRWPMYWSFSFSISSSNEYSALISFRIDWFDLLAVQGTFKSLQHHNQSQILKPKLFPFVSRV